MHDEVGELPCEDGQTPMADALPPNLLDLSESGSFSRVDQLVFHPDFGGILVFDHCDASAAILEDVVQQRGLATPQEASDDQYRHPWR